MTMRAIVSHAPGPVSTLTIEDLPDLHPGENEVVIDVKACGVNFPDLLIIEDKYQFKPERPFTPGNETAGIVREVGSAVTELQAGDRVIGMKTWGGFAGQLCTDVSSVFPIPDSMDFPTAAGFLLTYATSYHALKDRAHLQPGETVCVLGAAGGVGLATVELAKAMGATVIAAASSDDKVAVAKEHGADEGFVYPRAPLDKEQQKALSQQIKDLTKGRGVDVIYDPVGGDYAEPALRSMAWNGRYLVIGFASGPIPKIPLNLTLLKGCSIVGVFWGAFSKIESAKEQQNIRELMDMFEAGKIKTRISAMYPLEDFATAMDDIAQRRATGKVILLTE